MKLVNVRFNTREFNRVMKNAIRYSDGFVDGIEIDKRQFMMELGEFVSQILHKYVDAQAKANPQRLHHVYEWGKVGSPSSRLFFVEPIAGPQVIRFDVFFLASDSTSKTATEPFIYKAETMEKGMSITVVPKFSDYLVFDIDNHTVFTKNEITINNPGGPAVKGSFKETIDEFFSQYLTNVVLQPFLKDLATAEEYAKYFRQGANGGGYNIGIRSGKLYLSSAGMRLA